MLRVEPRRDAERVLAADRDQRVEPGLGEVREHPLDPAVDLVRVRPRRADDRPAARQDPTHLARGQRSEVVLDEPAPSVRDADDLVPPVEAPSRDGANHGVEPGAVAAAREDADALHRRLSLRVARLARMRRVGIEPTRPEGQWLLRPSRLPVAPPPRGRTDCRARLCRPRSISRNNPFKLAAPRGDPDRRRRPARLRRKFRPAPVQILAFLFVALSPSGCRQPDRRRRRTGSTCSWSA